MLVDVMSSPDKFGGGLLGTKNGEENIELTFEDIKAPATSHKKKNKMKVDRPCRRIVWKFNFISDSNAFQTLSNNAYFTSQQI